MRRETRRWKRNGGLNGIPHLFYRNDGGGAFTQISSASIVKLDSRGNPIWQAINGISPPSFTATDGSGNVYVAGGGKTIKYVPNGIRVWQTSSPFPDLFALDAAGNIYTAGTAGGYVIVKYGQVPNPGAPVIATPPLHPLARPGDTVTLSVNATGDAPLSYLWRWPSGSPPPGTNAAVTLTNVQPARGGLYDVEVTNALGSAASSVVLSVLSPLSDQTVILGAPASFVAPLSGGPAAFQWRFNGVNLPGENNAMLGSRMPDRRKRAITPWWSRTITATFSRVRSRG